MLLKRRGLGEDQLTAYRRDGFVAPVEVMSAADAHDLRLALESAEASAPERLTADNRNNAHYEFPFLDAIVHDTRVLDAVQDIVGRDILLWSSVLFIKEPQSPAHVSFHQDATYMGLEPQAGVTAWLALTEATMDNGCMLMERGSHRGAIREHSDTFAEDNILTRGQTIGSVDQAAVVPVELQPGQMSLHHVRTVHASAPNHTGKRRIGFAMQAFFAPDAVQTLGHDYSLLVRGEDRYGHFRPGRRPAAEGEADAKAFRDVANARFAEILYAGSRERRAL